MKLTQRYLISALVTAPAVLGLVVAPPATADCSSSGYATVCAQGDVRGGDGGSTVSGPVYPIPARMTGFAMTAWTSTGDQFGTPVGRADRVGPDDLAASARADNDQRLNLRTTT